MKDNGLQGSLTDNNAVGGYISAQLMHKVLEAAGDNLTRENIMSKVRSINEKTLPMLLPGITVKTTDDDVSVFHGLHLVKFEGESWALFGDVITE
jgi:branched-chain amino acid transport system substrate-binding protein